MPAQEAFMLALKKSEWSGLAVACGGYLDQLSGGLQYYPKWIDRLNLRFLYRLAREPHRLWRRYILEYRVFLLRLIKQLLKHRLGVVSKRP
ncbi:UDP-Gal:alpha-D-GlcNAc-diphosphoundecaprenol beta-1,4-galactosyltransferase [compost metagenome]